MDGRNNKIPKAVYYQCVWIVKDMERLKRLSLAADAGYIEDELVFFETDEEAVRGGEVLRQAKFKLQCIAKALGSLPEEYRQCTIESIVYGTPFSHLAHENTWRKWRRVFIRELAGRLSLI